MLKASELLEAAVEAVVAFQLEGLDCPDILGLALAITAASFGMGKRNSGAYAYQGPEDAWERLTSAQGKDAFFEVFREARNAIENAPAKAERKGRAWQTGN